MERNTDYKTEQINGFRELFCRIRTFGNRTAFFCNGISHTYEDFCEDVEKAMRVFFSSEKFVLLNIRDKYFFSVAYFATVLSGNIACLQAFSEKRLSCFERFDFVYEWDDARVRTVLSQADSSEAVFRENKSFSTVLCSSGTTAAPKAVALSEKNIFSVLNAGTEQYRFEEGGVYVNILPYTHAFGLVVDLLAPLYSASTIYLTSDIVSFFVHIASVHPTALNITPELTEAILLRIESAGDKERVVGSRLRKILSGGAGTPFALCQGMARFGIGVYGCYGLSECAPCVSVNRDGHNKFGSAGTPLSCNTVSVDPSGVITVKGSNIMMGYLDLCGRLLDMPRGEYRTGDVGYIDEDGFLFVQGRSDDLIVFPDGNKLTPWSVESELNGLDGVKESAVYMRDGALAATIVVADTNHAATVATAVRKRVFHGYKIMKLDITTEPLARNALGKWNRRFYERQNHCADP